MKDTLAIELFLNCPSDVQTYKFPWPTREYCKTPITPIIIKSTVPLNQLPAADNGKIDVWAIRYGHALFGWITNDDTTETSPDYQHFFFGNLYRNKQHTITWAKGIFLGKGPDNHGFFACMIYRRPGRVQYELVHSYQVIFKLLFTIETVKKKVFIVNDPEDILHLFHYVEIFHKVIILLDKTESVTTTLEGVQEYRSIQFDEQPSSESSLRIDKVANRNCRVRS